MNELFSQLIDKKTQSKRINQSNTTDV